MNYCSEQCTPKDYKKTGKYTLGKCDTCGSFGGVAECEYRPEIINDINSIFGDLNNKPKK